MKRTAQTPEPKAETQTAQVEEPKVEEVQEAEQVEQVEQTKIASTASENSADAENATEIVMPQMGESITEGTVSKWLKEVGEKVEKDEPLVGNFD